MTPLAEQDLPPGVKRLIDYMGRPWGGLLDSFNMEINGQIDKATDLTDLCIHTLIKPEEGNELLTVQFDWQRTFGTEWQSTRSNLERVLEDALKDSIDYFEQLAEGNRFDEVLISEAANA